jgi:hypothetical protein
MPLEQAVGQSAAQFCAAFAEAPTLAPPRELQDEEPGAIPTAGEILIPLPRPLSLLYGRLVTRTYIGDEEKRGRRRNRLPEA